MSQRWINNDVYIYERKFFGNVVLVAINKNETTGYSISGLNTSLPAGSYSDYLTGLARRIFDHCQFRLGRQQSGDYFHSAGAHCRRLAVHRRRSDAADWFDWTNERSAGREDSDCRQELRLHDRHGEVRHDDRDRKFVDTDANHRHHAVGYKRQLQRHGNELE